MSKLTSYEADIRPLFTQRDIQGMSKAFNLASYDDVKTPRLQSSTGFAGLAALSCHRHRRGEKGAGLNLASISSANGWRTAFSLRRSGVTAAHA
jgi:hypothetical protein